MRERCRARRWEREEGWEGEEGDVWKEGGMGEGEER